MTVTVLEKREHYFELENEMPILPRKAPKRIYLKELKPRALMLGIGIVLSIIIHSIPDVWQLVRYIPSAFMVVAILGIFDSLQKANDDWRKEQHGFIKSHPAYLELVDRLTELNPLYKGRLKDSVMFEKREHYSGSREFFIDYVWERYIEKLYPTKRELRKGFGPDRTGGSLHISNNEGWSFHLEFVTPSCYKMTVKRVRWDKED